MNKIIALAGVVIKELYRRKDFYVLFVLTALLTFAAWLLNFFHDEKIVRYIKDICLLLIWVSALVIAIVTTSRQIPAEREARTIFPLLAKPVSRGQVVAGKFLGCWLATGVALLVFYFFFAIITGSKEQIWPVIMYLQAAWLQWCMLAIVIAMVLLGSIYFAAPSSTSTISFIVVVGILGIGSHLKVIALQQPEPMQLILTVIYFVMPHLEWFDLRDFVVYDQTLVSWPALALATGYAAIWTGIFLLLAWLGFNRKNLTT
jgi:ABC-type transport system involved in multi-copper enzyme maturation permease subunit